MAPERIFQGRQRGILGLVGGKDTCTSPPSTHNHLTKSAMKAVKSERRLQPLSSPPKPDSQHKTRTPRFPPPAPGDLCASGVPKAYRSPGGAALAGLAAAWKGRTERGGRSFSRASALGLRAAAGTRLCQPRALPGAQGGLPYRCGPRVPGALRSDVAAWLARAARWQRCALGGGADALAARAPARSPRVCPRWRRLLCLECESFRFPHGIKANHK